MKPSIAVSVALYRRHERELMALIARYGLAFTVAEGESVGFGGHTYLLEEGFTLKTHLTLPHRTSERLTLLFHTLEEAFGFIASHPDPQSEYPALIETYGKMLREGELVAFPTETVYGLGADATNEDAVRAIFIAKERPLFDPLIVHVAQVGQLEEVVATLDERTLSLIDHFWPGPLTLVVKKHPTIPAVVTSGGGTVAIRMPDNPLALSLIEESRRPIAAPSANRFGYTSPTTAAHVHEQLGDRIAAILDGGSCPVGIESTVLSLVTDPPTILRPGKIGEEELVPIIGQVSSPSTVHDSVLESPGLLENHYAPTTALYLVDDVSQYKDDPTVGVLLFERSAVAFKGPVRYISEKEDAAEAASRLYWAMRQLDTLNLRMMVCSLMKEEGIGVAINNRLKKASRKR